MTETTITGRADAQALAAQKAVEEAQTWLEQLDRLWVELRGRLEKERAGPPPSAEILEAAVQEARAQVDSIQAEINEAKSEAKKCKREIDEWKLWYQGLSSIDKTAEWAELQSEIDWRGIKINALQERIGALETKRLNAVGRLARVRQSLAALNAGVYDRPLEEDPRLVALQAERAAAAAALEAAKAGL